MSAPPALSVVVPAYNEAARIGECVRRLREYLKPWAGAYEALIVVEKSEDATVEVARAAAGGDASFQVLPQRGHRGKGFAVRTGMLAARGDVVFFMDADLSTSLSEIRPFLDRFEADPKADVLIGSRRHQDTRIVRAQTPWRRGMGVCFNGLVQSLTLRGIEDTQCGFKAFRRTAAREIFSRQRLDGFAFDVEVLLLASRLGLTVRELPVQWTNSPLSKVRIVRDSAHMLLELLLLRLRLGTVGRLPLTKPETGTIIGPGNL